MPWHFRNVFTFAHPVSRVHTADLHETWVVSEATSLSRHTVLPRMGCFLFTLVGSQYTAIIPPANTIYCLAMDHNVP